ncbi:MAG: transposase [Fidelibacterota bacterium]
MYKRSLERKHNRLPDYNYSNPGYYFITICTKNKIPFFASIKDHIINLNSLGKIAHECWTAIPNHFGHVSLDEFVIMPNHIHGIIAIKPSIITNVGDADLLPLHGVNRSKMLIPKIIHGFKSTVTRKIHKQFPTSEFVWQRSYYDHIIRDNNGLEKIRLYIKSNPEHWLNDKNYINPLPM